MSINASATSWIAAILLATIATAAQAQESYRLRPGDVLEFWVAQDEQLHRSITIGPDGRLSMPMVGHMMVEGRTIDEVEEEAKQRLRRFYTDSLDLTVMLEPHPSHLPSVFVAGEVTQPGVFAYRPGMMVIHAITLAGGPYRTPLEARDVDRSILLRSEIDAAQKSRVELVFTIARLEAELAGADTISTPDLETDLPASQIAEIQRREQALLDLKRTENASVAGTADELRQINERNLEALRQQQATIARRKEFMETRLGSISTLVDRGSVERSRLLELQGDLAELDGVASEMEAQLAVAEAGVVNERSRSSTVSRDRQVEIVTELNEARRQLEALTVRLEDNRRALAVYEAEGAGGEDETPVTYRIIRLKDGRSIEIEASRSTIVEPGDLVEAVQGAGEQRLAGSARSATE